MRPRSLFHLRSLTAAVLTVLTVAVPAGAAEPGAANTQAIVDLELREVTFNLSQQAYVTALDALNDARRLPAIGPRKDESTLTLAGLYLSLGLPAEAERTLRELSARKVAVPERAWLNLARLLLQRDRLREAEQALSNLRDLPPGPVQAERDYLLSLVLLERKRYAEAIAVAKGLQGDDEWSEVGRYNLAIALLATNRGPEGTAILERVATNKLPDELGEALRERANLMLGYYLLDHNDYEHGRAALARTTGRQGALGAGWLEYESGKHDIALQRWTPLAAGDSHDEMVQEALVALPRAHYQTRDYVKAAAGYEQALRSYEQEKPRIDAAAAAVEDGSLLNALLRLAESDGKAPNWYRPQTALPVHPASVYVTSTLASHVFQESFKNYRDLLFMQDALQEAGNDIAASLSLINAQRRLHGARLAEIMARSKRLDESGVFAEAQRYKDEFARAERDGNAQALATTKQKRQLFLLHRTEQRLGSLRDYIIDHQELDDKYHLLRGLLITDLAAQYAQRLWDTRKAMTELDQALVTAARANEHFQQAAEQPRKQIIEGRDGAFNALRTQREQLEARTQALLGEQRAYLITLLAREVRARRQHLEHYMAQARLGIGQAYDQLAVVSGKSGDYQRALDAYRRALDLAGSAEFRHDTLLRMAVLEMTLADQIDADRLNGGAKKSTRGSDAEINATYQKAIVLLQEALRDAPKRADNDRALYLLAKAYEHNGETDQVLETLDRMVREYPGSTLADEVQFRRGELLFALGATQPAAEAYGAVVTRGAVSPYYEKALYMHGWSLYKAGVYAPALDSFLTLLDRKLRNPRPVRTTDKADAPTLSAGDEELVSDVLRVTSLSLAQLNGVTSIERFFAQRGARPYEYRLYEALAALYATQERVEDAANVYRAYIAKYPNDARAPEFQGRILADYQQAGFTALVIANKEDFVRRYQADSSFWAQNPNVDRNAILKQVHDYIAELARYHHARAQSGNQPGNQSADYALAQQWYRQFLKTYPQDPDAIEMTFLLAESLYENRQYDEAVREYENVAFAEPAHARSAEAGYAAILAYQKLEERLSGDALIAAQHRTIGALQRYAASFPQDGRATAALAKAAEGLFALNDLQAAETVARAVIDHQPPAAAAERESAWRIIAYNEFETARYADAEQSYQQTLALLPKNQPRRELDERLAAAIYKQGEAAVQQGDRRAAVQHFLRVGQVTPSADIRVNADYDAAANLLVLEDWPAAITVLEAFRSRYPASPLQKELPAKLAYAYQKSSSWRQAAGELELLATRGDSADIRREALWQAAELYGRAQQPRDALRVYQQYVQQYPQPLVDAVEAHQRIADLYAQQGDVPTQRLWLARLVAAEQQGGAARTDRSRSLAAAAALVMAEDRYREFAAIKLSHPLEKNLKLKTKAMEDSLQAYNVAAGYGIADVTTAATYHSAEIYAQLSKDLLASERPANLSPLELEQYNVLLEEQAYHFEEKAIALYEANARRAAADIYDEWVKKSYAALGTLLPARYAKTEKAEAYIEALY